jgi:hypothetical protein
MRKPKLLAMVKVLLMPLFWLLLLLLVLQLLPVQAIVHRQLGKALHM